MLWTVWTHRYGNIKYLFIFVIEVLSRFSTMSMFNSHRMPHAMKFDVTGAKEFPAIPNFSVGVNYIDSRLEALPYRDEST